MHSSYQYKGQVQREIDREYLFRGYKNQICITAVLEPLLLNLKSKLAKILWILNKAHPWCMFFREFGHFRKLSYCNICIKMCYPKIFMFEQYATTHCWQTCKRLFKGYFGYLQIELKRMAPLWYQKQSVLWIFPAFFDCRPFLN